MKKSKANGPNGMAKPLGAEYLKVVKWSDEDGCYVGSAPPLVGPSCHGLDAAEVFREISQIVEEHLKILEEEGLPIPPATLQETYSGKILLRATPALHQDLAICAAAAGEGLNEYCVRQLNDATVFSPGPQMIHCDLLNSTKELLCSGMFQYEGKGHVPCFLPLPRVVKLSAQDRGEGAFLRFTKRLTFAISDLRAIGNGAYRVVWHPAAR